VLVLRFRFADEMKRIFEGMAGARTEIALVLIDDQGSFDAALATSPGWVALVTGALIATWEDGGGWVGAHSHTENQKRKHTAGMALAGGLAAVAGTTVNTVAAASQVPVGIVLTGVPGGDLD
jgi:hypothetical protein